MAYNASIFSKGAGRGVRALTSQQQNNKPHDRSFLNEVFDLLSIGQYATAGYATESLRARNEGRFDPFAGVKGAAKGVAQGLSIAPGWEGFKDPADYSYGKDVLTELGWKPETTGGKIAKGVLGFAGDVLLDPLTYVSLGGTSVLKGSGKVGKEVVESATRSIAGSISEKATKEVGESLATGGLRQLSKESAEEIVTNFARKSGIEIDPAKISQAADDYIKKYNELLGQNRLGNKGATIGAENIPFANKFFKDPSKYTFEFVSKETMEKLGDKTVAPYLDRITESFYNSPLGKKFSTKTGLRELAKRDPEMLYQTMEFMKLVGKNNPNRVEQIQLLKKWVEDNNITELTPAKQKQAIKALTGKEVVKYLDVQTGKSYDSTVKAYDDYVRQMQSGDDFVKDVQSGVDEVVNARPAGVTEAMQDEIFKQDKLANKLLRERPLETVDFMDRRSKIQKMAEVFENDFSNASKTPKGGIEAFARERKMAKRSITDMLSTHINDLELDKAPIWENKNISDKTFDEIMQIYQSRGETGLINWLNTRTDIRLELSNLYEQANKFSAQKAGVGKKSHIFDRLSNGIKEFDPEFAESIKASIKERDFIPNKLIDDIKDNFIKKHGEKAWSQYGSRFEKMEKTRQKARYRFLSENKRVFLNRDPQMRFEWYQQHAKNLEGTEFNKRTLENIKNIEKIQDDALKTSQEFDLTIKQEALKGETDKLIDELFERGQKTYPGQLDETGEDMFKKTVKTREASGTNKASQQINEYAERVGKLKKEYDMQLLNAKERRTYEKLVKEYNELSVLAHQTGDETAKKKLLDTKQEMKDLIEAKRNKGIPGKKGQNLKKMKAEIDDLEARISRLTQEIDLPSYDDKASALRMADQMKVQHGEAYEQMLKENDKIYKATKNSVNKEITDDIIRNADDAAKNIEVEDLNDILSREEFIETRLQTQIKGLTPEEAKGIMNVRNEFIKLGQAEVSAGLLGSEQFIENWGKYFPKLRTKAGAQDAAKQAMSKDIRTYITDLFGIKQTGGLASSKTSHVDDLLKYNEEKGFEFFMEDVANVYMARAMAHNDAFYQRNFAKKLVDNLGAKAFNNGVYIQPEKGFKTGIAYGDLMDQVSKVARQEARIKMEGRLLDPREFQKELAAEITQAKTNMAVRYGLNFNDATDWGKPIIELSGTDAKRMIDELGLENRVKNLHEAQVDVFNHARNVELAKKSNQFLNTYDKFLQLWKLNVTAIIPGFHTRNAISNQWQNFLKIGSDITDPKLQLGATRTMQAKFKGASYADEFMPGMTWGDLYDEAERVGAVGKGYFASDFEEGKTAFESIKELAQGEVADSAKDAKRFFENANLNPLDAGKGDRPGFIGYEIGQELGSLVENRDRLLHYGALRRAGESAEAAAESVNKFLFDYEDLTVFEHTVMKRLFPFYTWMKKNTQLQIEQAVLQPGLYRNLKKVLNAVEGGESEDKYVPKWAEDYVQLPFDIDGEDAYINPNLPIQDLNNLPRSADRVDFIGQILSKTTPAIKAPVELALGRNMYFDSPIENKFDYLMNYFSAYNFAKSQASPTKDKVDKQLNLLNKATGIGIKRF